MRPTAPGVAVQGVIFEVNSKQSHPVAQIPQRGGSVVSNGRLRRLMSASCNKLWGPLQDAVGAVAAQLLALSLALLDRTGDLPRASSSAGTGRPSPQSLGEPAGTQLVEQLEWPKGPVIA